MNVFIIAVCVSKPSRSGYSNNVQVSDPDEVISILPGFYLEKPKELSKSLFKNPKAWPDDIYAILDKEEAERNKIKVNENTEIKTSEDKYLRGQILKAVEDLKRLRASQNKNNGVWKKNKKHIDDLIHKSGKKIKAHHINSKNPPKKPAKKLLGRVFRGMNSGIDYKIKQRYKKVEKNTGSENNRVLGELIKKILSGGLNPQPYQKSEQHTYAKPEEESHSKEEFLGNILNGIQNNPLEREREGYQRPSMVIFSPTSLDNDDYEMDNNAKEEISDEDYGGTDLLNLNTRRRSKTSSSEYDIGGKIYSFSSEADIGGKKYSSSSEADIGGKKNSKYSTEASESRSSDYEKNPGNPYTVHKNKYKQNWPYNHFMDGDHMNINPMGPQFGSLGPSGPELFFGRKWWYFNQDDYKPMR